MEKTIATIFATIMYAQMALMFAGAIGYMVYGLICDAKKGGAE